MVFVELKITTEIGYWIGFLLLLKNDHKLIVENNTNTFSSSSGGQNSKTGRQG